LPDDQKKYQRRRTRRAWDRQGEARHHLTAMYALIQQEKGENKEKMLKPRQGRNGESGNILIVIP